MSDQAQPESNDLVLVTVEDGIATLRLNRGKVNAIAIELMRALSQAADEVEAREDVRAVIVWGGEKCFAAGADIKQMRELSFTDMVELSRAYQECMRKIDRLPVPTVAAITGFALGAGCELALACDFRIAAAGAKLGQPEVLLGVIPGCGGSQRLPRLIGPAKAKDLIFTGRFVEAEEALELGLVDEVVAPEEVYAAAVARMERYRGSAKYALRFAKEAIDRGLGMDLASGLDLESYLFASCFATKDRTTGMDSFVESGPGKATFEGK